jgi:hypothetical protein
MKQMNISISVLIYANFIHIWEKGMKCAQPFACVDNECRVFCETKGNKLAFMNNTFWQ